MSFDHIRSWYELEEITERQERMITIYEKEIKQLEQEKAQLKEEILILKTELENVYANEDDGNISKQIR
jgi:DNA-directed RNA polymerase delta subunit|tara:strand:- start:1916 stop:2122 length:207 start_codon:yes stop_codon:yes gene_type:complete